MTKATPTSIRLPKPLDEQLHLKSHLLSIERGVRVSKNQTIVELLEAAIRNSEGRS